jgi:hypothetical protein
MHTQNMKRYALEGFSQFETARKSLPRLVRSKPKILCFFAQRILGYVVDLVVTLLSPFGTIDKRHLCDVMRVHVSFLDVCVVHAHG